MKAIMGGLNIQVKVLKETAPVLFTWWNKDSDAAEGYLITCKCQNWDLLGESPLKGRKRKRPNLEMENGNNLHKETTMKLCGALEKAEIISIPFGVCGESILEIEPSSISQSGRSKREGTEDISRASNGSNLIEGVAIERNDVESQQNIKPCTVTTGRIEDTWKQSGKKRRKMEGEGAGAVEEHRVEIKSRTNNINLSHTAVSKVIKIIEEESCVLSENLAADILSDSEEMQSTVGKDIINKSASLNIQETGGTIEGGFENELLHNSSNHNNDAKAIESSTKHLSINNVNEDKPPIDAKSISSDRVHTKVVNGAGISSDTVVVVSDNRELSDVDSLFRVLKGIMDGEIPQVESNEVTILNPGVNFARLQQGATTTFEEQEKLRYLKKLHKKPRNGSVEKAICEICGAISTTLTIRKHLATCHYQGKRERNYECEICGQKFFKCDNLNRHKRLHSDPKFHCQQCDRSFRQAYQLKAHIKTHLGYKQPARIRKPTSRISKEVKGRMSKFVVCKECDLKMDCTSITEHLQTEHGIKPPSFKCSHCGKELSNSSSLKIHELRHTGLTYKCGFCEITYKSNTDRLRHEKIHTDIISKCGKLVFKCGFCEKWYTRQTDRIRHEMTHVDKTIDPSHMKYREGNVNVLVDCDICGKTLRQQSMRNHILSHHHQSWTCKICLKTFTYSYRYQHAKLHEGNKPHACQHCTAKFLSKSALVVHMRKHTKEKPIPCRYCEQTFSRHGARNNHERLHTGERPYECNLCQKAWRDRPTYMQHMKKHHPGVPMMKWRKPNPQENQTTEEDESPAMMESMQSQNPIQVITFSYDTSLISTE